MPLKFVLDAVNSRLAANWTATPIIKYDQQARPPAADVAFLVVQFPIVNGVQPTLGRLYWETGIIRLVLSVRRDMGYDQGAMWADELAHMFRAVTFDGIQTGVPDGAVLDDTADNGNWIIFSLIIPYRYEYESAAFEFVSA